MALSPGTRIGPYEVISLVGVGGMGEVYRGRNLRLQRAVALKILPELFASDPDRLARFEREARTLAALSHPHIAGIYGIEESNGLHALALEFVDGETLADRIARGSIRLDEALPIARQIAEAVEAAHQHGIVHRDLKPANINITPDGVVKVLDFGLAKLSDAPVVVSESSPSQSPTVTSPALVTRAGVLLGTAVYMSAEQARGKPAEKRSDIWAFGCVLYEMLTGKRAFQGHDVSETLAAVLKADPDWTALPADVSAAIATLLRRCLERDRQKRIADLSTAVFVIRELQDLPETVAATKTTQGRHWIRTISMVSAAAVAGALSGAALWRLAPSAVLPVTRFAVTLGEGQQFAGTSRHVLAISADGTQIAYYANDRLFLRSLSALEARPIPGTNAPMSTPVFSPDGRSICLRCGAGPEES